jgi:hypothetical protein
VQSEEVKRLRGEEVKTRRGYYVLAERAARRF